MTYKTITLTITDGLAELTLSRPDKLNSFTAEMHGELRAALDEVEAAGARALILTGAGRGFCAGQDLADPAFEMSDDFDVGVTLEKDYGPLVTRLRDLPLPVICAVNGVAAGAGANVALACDIVLAARSATFLQAFARIGLIPDAGGTWTLTRRLGEARAKGLAMLAEPLAAQAALDWGLIWAVHDDDRLMDEARTLGQRLVNQPTRAFALIKKAVHAAAGNSLEEQLALEAELQRAASRTHDFKEGVTAFLEKRKPRFKGE